ncbi:MAG: alpha/beta hydrolase [Anaerolineae bacterium]|nr:alpha/beta hydrolase [Anaerolineae bacterium]
MTDYSIKTITAQLSSGKTGPAPTVECWIPAVNPHGVGLIILPGGGYQMLAQHEGAGYAEFFCKSGIACFVVTYRLGSNNHRHPAMLEDALATIETIRTKAGDFGIDPDKLGIIGSSAGGHLAAHTLTSWHQYEGDVSLRPSFGILCYPVILSSGPYANAGSISNLAGESLSSALLDSLSCDKQVSAQTPPCFLWHTVEDTVVPVENSLQFASALRQHHVPFELHIFPNGRHGLGLETPFDWANACLRWIEETTQG